MFLGQGQERFGGNGAAGVIIITTYY
jgi:hypothetical protein